MVGKNMDVLNNFVKVINDHKTNVYSSEKIGLDKTEEDEVKA